MYQLVMLIHVFVAVCIVALVLVQQGKGAAMGAAFGSGASQTVFGSRGSGSFLFRLTLSFVAVFFVTSVALNYMVMRTYKQQKNVVLPFVPATKPATNSSTPATALPPPVQQPVQMETNKQQDKTAAPLVPPAPAATPAPAPKQSS